MMIPKIKTLSVLPDYHLSVTFDNGRQVVYDVKDDIEHTPGYGRLLDKALFASVRIGKERAHISWTSDIDLPSDILYEYGK